MTATSMQPVVDTFQAAAFGPEAKAVQALPDIRPILLMDDPYPVYKALQEQGDIIEIAASGMRGRHFAVLGYKASEGILKNPAFSNQIVGRDRAASKGAFDAENFPETYREIRQRQVLDLEGKQHIQIRTLFKEGFTPEAVRRIEPSIRRIAKDLIGQALAKDSSRIDLINDYAKLLPLQVIGEILGVPEILKQLDVDSATIIARANGFTPTSEDFARASEYAFKFGQQIIKSLQSGGDAAKWLTKWQQGGNSDPRMLVANLAFYILAGYETTSNSIGNLFNLFIKFPEVLDGIRNKQIQMSNVVKEALRYDSSVQTLSRVLIEDCNVEGISAKKGDVFTLIIGSANRDERQYPNADLFDPRRAAGYGLAFGAGKHICHGMQLALPEIEIAAEVFLEEIKGFSVIPDEPAIRKTNPTLRGHASYPLAISIY